MAERIYTLIEICNIICCLHFLYGKKIKINIPSALLICADCVLFELINMYSADRSLSMIMYFLIFIYCIVEFNVDIKSLIAGNLLYVTVLGLVQLLGMMFIILFRLESLDGSYIAIIINLIAFGLLIVIRKKLHKLCEYFVKKNIIVVISFIISFCVMMYGIVQYKRNMETTVGQFMILLIVGSLISILAYSWQKEKEIKFRVEMELQMHKMYEESFANLISTMRKNQHEFHNHLQAIAGMHYTLHTYEDLVNEQKEYFGSIMQENKFYRLLSSNWPVLAGFLYSKFSEADAKGITIDYTINAEREMCTLPEFIMIEILGILLDNAIEAVEKIENPTISVRILKEETVVMEVANPIKGISYGDIVHFFEEGYTSKNQHSGLGLHKIVEYGKKYNFEPQVLKSTYNEREYLVISVKI